MRSPLLLVAPAALAAAALVLFSACDSGGRSYSENPDDNGYDLEEMSLRNADVPSGMSIDDGGAFDSSGWAMVLAQGDTEQATLKKNQLDAQGFVKDHISVFNWQDPSGEFGKVARLSSQSTLYADNGAASKSIHAEALCGLRLDSTADITEFDVPKIGDESVGLHTSSADNIITNTVICFRTGRVVHGIVEESFRGGENVALAVTLAEKMLKRVDASFDGKNEPVDEIPTPSPQDDTSGG